jgi:multiple sugar transport system ATP-binding protein
VLENIALGLKLRKTAKHEIDTRVKRVASILEISHLLDRKPSQLSGGQKQRVALGRAIAREPQVFLMDEPLSNLDAKLRAQTRAELIKLQQELRRTTVYVTHDQVEAMTMGSRIVVMKDGVIQQVAPPRKLYDEPANVFVAGFIGSPQMNFIKGTIEVSDGFYYFSNKRMRLLLPENCVSRLERKFGAVRNVILGVRPEHISLCRGRIDDPSFLPGIVQMTEETGADSYVYIQLGHIRLIVRTEPVTRYETDEIVSVGLQMNKIHFFDETTELVFGRDET